MPQKTPLMNAVAIHLPMSPDLGPAANNEVALTHCAAHQAEKDQLAKCVQTEVSRQLIAGSNDIYEQVIQLVEATMIMTVMANSNQNLTRAAQRLGVSRPTLRTKIRARMPFQ